MSGWFGTAVGVLLYDLWRYKNGKDTMSTAWGKWLDHRLGRPLCIVGWGALTTHLFWNPLRRSLRRAGLRPT